MTNNHIIINELKGIRHLDFEIPNPGVYVITAANGSGKTTLLHCIERLTNKRVFNENFTQHGSWNVDSFEFSKITYKSHLGNEVTYTYREHLDSWRPTTYTASAIKDFNYQEINAIPTLGLRIYIQKKTIRGGHVKAAPSQLRSAMAYVLENSKFERLLKFNLGETRGRGGSKRRKNIAFLLPRGYMTKYGSRMQTYYSESNFSLGEIFTLNLLYELDKIAVDSLLVIDELEVALHPKVQKNLLRNLESRAREKNLTVLISTHSSTLIKCAKNLIFLQNDGNGNIQTHHNCYPALALREVAVEEDMQPDYVFFVEDSAADMYIKEKLRYYFTINPTKQQPVWKVLPIGGYPAVLRFTDRANQYLLQNGIAQYAFLDQDVQEVKTELLRKGNARTEAENELMDLFTSLERRIKYLSITPELGLWEWLNNETVKCQEIIDHRFPDAQINVRNLLQQCSIDIPYSSANPRTDAKKRIAWVCKHISELSNQNKARIKQHLFACFVLHKYSIQANRNELNRMFGSVFRDCRN